MPSSHFRAGVVMVVRHRDDVRVLAVERQDTSGAWQLPQGGIEMGETPVQAAWRELREETGLGRADVDLVAEYPRWTSYTYPDGPLQKGDGERLGQTQRWFVFRCRDASPPIRLDGRELADWRWADPLALARDVVEFRSEAYDQVLAHEWASGGTVGSDG